MSSFAETPLLSAVLSVLLIHPSMGAAAVDSLSSIAVMDPKLGVPLLLAIMFYSNIFTRNDIICHDMLVSPPFCTVTNCVGLCCSVLSMSIICNINIYFSLSLFLNLVAAKNLRNATITCFTLSNDSTCSSNYLANA
jgi:hypothetical protein